MAEESAGHEEAEASDDGHRPVLRPQQVHGGTFQKYAAQDDEEVAQRIGIGDQLQVFRHVGDGRREAGQNDGRNEKQKRAQQPLLLRDRQRRDHQTHAD